MQLDPVELGDIRTLILLVGAGLAVPVAKGQVTAGLGGVHGIEHPLLVPHKAVQLVFRSALCLLPGRGLGGRVCQQVQNTCGFRAGKAPAFIPGQAEQIQQHLAVQPAVDLLQVQLFGAGLVVHHPHPAGAVFLHPLVGAIHRAHQLHRASVREMIHLPGHGILPGADAQLAGCRVEAGLLLFVPQIAQKAGHAFFEAGEQVGEPGRILGQIALCIFIHQQAGKARHGFVVQFQKRRQRLAGVIRSRVRVQRHLQHPMHQGAALVG